MREVLHIAGRIEWFMESHGPSADSRFTAVSPTTTTGRPARTTITPTTRGTRTTTIGTTKTMSVQSGSLTKPMHPGLPGASVSMDGDQFLLFEEPKVSVEDLFQAYHDCRRHKRGTSQAVEFETDLESNHIGLLRDINERTYTVGPSSVFIVDRPVKREIFAAGFRDRIVHHLLLNYINTVIERHLIHDCYACRVGKGTLFGIERLTHFMRSATKNYSKTAWIMKLDIRGFFMSIDRRILWRRLREYLVENYHEDNLPLVLWLCEIVIHNDPTVNCVFKCQKSRWNGLPRSKSLFLSRKGCGLPIGNLTSQVFANFYMSALDHYVEHDLGIRRYGRYVDDFFLIHEERSYLLECRDRIESFLKRELHLELNHSKFYFQPVSHGVRFLGVRIRPGRRIIDKRTVNNFRVCIESFNSVAENHRPSNEELASFRSSVCSYLGIASHHDSYRMRRKVMGRLDGRVVNRIPDLII